MTVDGPLLSWAASARATSYDLYWGTGKNLAADADLGTPVQTTATAVTIRRPGATAAERTLAGETTYYWRVDAKNDAGVTKGGVWSFTTGEAPPAPPEEPSAGEETPPVETKQAPAWPDTATRFRIEEVTTARYGTKWKLPPPTGSPTPTVTVTGGMPAFGLSFNKNNLTFRKTDRQFAHSGAITLTASNSEGTATLKVPYSFTCIPMANALNRLAGAWEADERSWDDPDLSHDHYFQRVVIENGGVTATLRTGRVIGPLSYNSFTYRVDEHGRGSICYYNLR